MKSPGESTTAVASRVPAISRHRTAANPVHFGARDRPRCVPLAIRLALERSARPVLGRLLERSPGAVCQSRLTRGPAMETGANENRRNLFPHASASNRGKYNGCRISRKRQLPRTCIKTLPLQRQALLLQKVLLSSPLRFSGLILTRFPDWPRPAIEASSYHQSEIRFNRRSRDSDVGRLMRYRTVNALSEPAKSDRIS